MPGIQPVKGTMLRATKINSCGKPVAGPRSRLATSGYVSMTMTAVMQQAQDLQQLNAEGLICFQDRTPPSRRWYTPALELCNVNTGLLAMFTGWQTILDIGGDPQGYRDQDTIEVDFGIAIELWTAGKMDEDCAEIPTTDAGLADTGTGKSYGYFLFGGTEWTPGDIKISASVASFTLTGRTIPMPYWAQGPYNVQEASDGTARRLVNPTGQKEHLTVFRTTIAPPEPTDGTEPVALAVADLFSGTNYYYGGPSNAAPVAVAPEQGSAEGVTFTLTGTPAGGTQGLKVNGLEAAIPFNATASAAKALLVALDDGFTAADFTVTGGALPGTPLVIVTDFDADFELGTNALTGGTTPAGVLS
jgi:hypothetical protein